MKTRNYFGKLAGIAGILALLAASSVFAADKKETKKEQTQEERVLAIVNEYVGIHDALAADTTKDVNSHAAAIVKNADAALELAKKDEKKNVELIKSLKAVKTSVGKLAGDKLTIDGARDGFHGLSDAVIELAKKNLPEKTAEKYSRFYCPMAKGYWLQKGGETSNPYYGKQMLKCGNLVKDDKKDEKSGSGGMQGMKMEGDMHHGMMMDGGMPMSHDDHALPAGDKNGQKKSGCTGGCGGCGHGSGN